MQLNQNFQSALNPALFYSKKGENNSVQLGRFFAINSRLKLNLGVGYERVAFISGHESQVDYFISSETGSAENTIDLTMATPLGFIEGDAVIDRSDNITDDQTALRLDLTNEHKYQSADINFGLSYAVVSNNSFEISLQPSIALKRLFNISNELILVETNHQDFSTLSTQVTNNQESINKTLPELGLGLNLSKILSNSSSLGIFYQYRTGLKPIHSFQDFSTGFSSHNAGLRYEF